MLNLAAREIKDGWPSESGIMVDSTPRTSHIQPESSTSRTRSNSTLLAGFITTKVTVKTISLCYKLSVKHPIQLCFVSTAGTSV